ncbi:hypothetical protein CFE70_002108 [Pyrenophora teres f. teres 0-1]
MPPKRDEWDSRYREDDEWYTARDRVTASTRHVHASVPKLPPRTVRDDEDLRPDYGRRTSEYLAPQSHYTTGLHRTRSHGHAPAPNVTIYNTTRMDNESSPQVRAETKAPEASPRGRYEGKRTIPGAFELEDDIAELRADMKREHRSRSRHEYERHHHSPEPNYEDKIQLTIAQQRVKDLEKERERRHHSPEPNYEDKIQLTIAQQRVKDLEKDREQRRHYSPERSYEDKIQLSIAQQRVKDLESNLERERERRHHSPERNYEDKIQLTIAQQRLKDLESSLERERERRHHSPERNYEDKIQLTIAQQRLKDLENNLERERMEHQRNHSPDHGYEDKVKLAVSQQRLREAKEKLEKERQEEERAMRDELMRRRLELDYIKDMREREHEEESIRRQEEHLHRDWELKREREERDRERRELEEEKKRAAIIAENRAKMSREQREAEEQRDRLLDKIEREKRQQEEERKRILAESRAKMSREQREAEEQRDKILAKLEKEKREQEEERKHILAEARANQAREDREAAEQREKVLAKLEKEKREQEEERKHILAEARAKQAREEREAEEQREKILTAMEKKKKREEEERARIIAENTAKMEKEAREREAREKAMEEERKRIIAENEAKMAKQAKEAQEAQQRAVEDYQRKKAKEEAEANAEQERIIFEYERRKILTEEKEKKAREEFLLKLKLEEEEKKRKEKEEYDNFMRKQREREEEEKRKKEEQEKELEEAMRKRLSQFGFQENQIQVLVNPEKQKEQLQQGMLPNYPLQQAAPSPPPAHHHHHHQHQAVAIAPAPTYAKVHTSHLDVETLHYYNIPYEYDMDPNYIIILREMSQRDTDILFEHTRRLRSHHGSTLFIEAEGHDRKGRKEYAFVQTHNCRPDTTAGPLGWETFTSAGANVGALESEFDAFQAGRPVPPPQELQHFGPRFAQPPPQFAQQPQVPDWAADFQHLNISSQSPQTFQQQLRPQAANAASAWHQDFLRQQAPVAQSPVMQQNTYGGMSGYNMGGFGGQAYMQTPSFQSAQISETAQGKQRAQDDVPAFDEAAFEQAFAQAQQDMMEVASAEQSQAQAASETLNLDRTGEMDPLLRRIQETRPAVYSAIQVWSETGLGRTSEAVTYLDNMSVQERSGNLVQDANEAIWIVDSLQRIVNRDAPEQVKTRAEELIKAINQRLMSQYPLGTRVPMSQEQIWRDLEQAGYTGTPVHEHILQRPDPQQEEQKEDTHPPPNADDEMAETAGRLLERVADNTSEKFQNSQFLGLMRRLRDREVRVQEDKIVEVDQAQQPQQASGAGQQQQQSNQPSTTTTTTRIPDIDPTILNHAATDFESPVYSDDGGVVGLGLSQ